MFSMFVTLEVSKFSGWLKSCASCRESKGGHTVQGEVRPGRREAADNGGARSVQGRARLQIGSKARGGAHPEHAVHVSDFAGGVEAQRLVEGVRPLPSRKEGIHGAGRGAAREAVGGGRPWRTQRAGAGSTADSGQGTGRSARRTCCPCS